MKSAHIGPCERPAVQASFKKYELSRQCRSSVVWGAMNVVMVVFILSEILYGSIFEDLTKTYPIIWYLECVVGVWSILKLLFYDLVFCLQWLFENPVILTPQQYQLLAVDRRDKRFAPLQESIPHTDHSTYPSRGSPGVYHPQSTHIYPVVPISSPSSRIISPISGGGYSPGSPRMVVSGSPTFGSGSVYYTAGQNSSADAAMMSSGYVTANNYNPSFQDVTMQRYSPSSVNMSLRNRLRGGSADSPYSPTKFSPVKYNDVNMSLDTSDVARHPSPSTSPFSDDRIRNVNALNSYLQNQEERSELFHRDGYSPSSRLNTSGSGPCQDSYNMQWSPYSHVTQTEYTTPLNVYKIGTRSPLTSTKDEDEFGHMSPQAEELWLKFGAYRQDLDLWTENLRKWISQTVLCKLVQEIGEINADLQRIGSSELQIGLTSIGSLRQVSTSKAEHVPTLAAILPYLELSNNQEYLVKRIQELGQDSCMGVYRWNSGSDYRGRRWDQDLPTDAQIIMHVFRTYMDSRLPTDARFPDGRTFTGLYFLKNLDKPESKKRDLAIHRFRQNPPHFKVIAGDEVFDVGKGRNNLFHSIILFLLMVKTKHHGMLGRVNLGLSGVNVLGIFSKR